eukprot:scaffold26970_cov104-Isochrysis_galbana.AAC.4
MAPVEPGGPTCTHRLQRRRRARHTPRGSSGLAHPTAAAASPSDARAGTSSSASADRFVCALSRLVASSQAAIASHSDRAHSGSSLSQAECALAGALTAATIGAAASSADATSEGCSTPAACAHVTNSADSAVRAVRVGATARTRTGGGLWSRRSGAGGRCDRLSASRATKACISLEDAYTSPSVPCPK